MTQVVLENISKQFPAQRGDLRSTVTIVDPALAQPTANAAEALVVPDTSSGGQVAVLQRINLTIIDGEFMVLVGPSGCGKSTLLRLIAGLEAPSAGSIWVGDRRVNDLPPKARDIAMVFQSYALYPHMTVYDNLAFGLRRTQRGGKQQPSLPQQGQQWLGRTLVGLTRRLPPSLRYVSGAERQIAAQVQQVAQMLELEPLLQRYPKQLSGGQKQRVALGRAMARDPQVFLMDEPLSNLDAKLRAQTRAQIVQLQRQLGTTTIYVTHDQTEAMTMGDRIAVLNGGEIQQIDTPLTLYQRPANRFVAEFIGSPPMNFLEMTVSTATRLTHPLLDLTMPGSWASVLEPWIDQSVTLGIRPEHFQLSEAAPHHLPARVALVEALGHETYLSCTIETEKTHTLLQVRIPPQESVQIGDQIWLTLDLMHIHLFEPNSGTALYPLAADMVA